ncbi:hypothetical protein BGP79_04020 [Tersicoccus sp. Bi-70]|nr:hypothetical protein BGP79_04020 [Tersicoccus sp. Bi-70]
MTVLADEVDDPAGPMMWEVLVGGVGLALLLVTIVGMVSVVTTRSLTGPVKAGWAVVVLALPLAGPAAWFLWRSRRTAQR